LAEEKNMKTEKHNITENLKKVIFVKRQYNNTFATRRVHRKQI